MEIFDTDEWFDININHILYNHFVFIKNFHFQRIDNYAFKLINLAFFKIKIPKIIYLSISDENLQIPFKKKSSLKFCHVLFFDIFYLEIIDCVSPSIFL